MSKYIYCNGKIYDLKTINAVSEDAIHDIIKFDEEDTKMLDELRKLYLEEKEKMSKGLDFIKRELELNDECFTTYERQGLKQVEKELKALEIIKNKHIDVNKEIYNINDYTAYVMRFGISKYLLTEEEFDLLKEVLENDRQTNYK